MSRQRSLAYVLSEQCATCIFRPGNKMQLNPGRVHSMVEECRARQTHIPCHETMVYEEYTVEEDDGNDEARVTRDSPVCRGFYDAYPSVSQLVRIAGRLGMLVEVNLEDALGEKEKSGV